MAIKLERITGKQRAARNKNVKIARASKGKGSKKKKISSKEINRRKKISTSMKNNGMMRWVEAKVMVKQ